MIHWVNLAHLKCLFISREHTLSLLGLHHAEHYPELTARRALPQTAWEGKIKPCLFAFCNTTDVSLSLSQRQSCAPSYKPTPDTSDHFGTGKQSIISAISSLPPAQQNHPSLFYFPFPEKNHLRKKTNPLPFHWQYPVNAEWVNPL